MLLFLSWKSQTRGRKIKNSRLELLFFSPFSDVRGREADWEIFLWVFLQLSVQPSTYDLLVVRQSSELSGIQTHGYLGWKKSIIYFAITDELQENTPWAHSTLDANCRYTPLLKVNYWWFFNGWCDKCQNSFCQKIFIVGRSWFTVVFDFSSGRIYIERFAWSAADYPQWPF